MSEQIPNLSITDCFDENAAGRQATINQVLDNPALTVIGVRAELEAAVNTVDQLDIITDAISDHPPGSRRERCANSTNGLGYDGVLQVNIATRDDSGHDNGPPFCYTVVEDPLAETRILVVSTFNNCLALVGKLGLAKSVNVLDIPTVVEEAVEQGRLPEYKKDKISNTQYRSLNFVPRFVQWTLQGGVFTSEEQPIPTLSDEDNRRVAFPDNFGNCILVQTPAELGVQSDGRPGQTVRLENNGQGLVVPYHERLADVPRGQLAVVQGSKGYGDSRWAEIVVRNGSASEVLGVGTDSLILPKR